MAPHTSFFRLNLINNQTIKISMESKTTNNHGGKRIGAGRKLGSGKFGESTTRLSIPESTKEVVLDFVAALAKRKQGSKQWPTNLEILKLVENPDPLLLPMFSHSIRAGFPSPADDYVADTLDLNEFLVHRKEATFFVKAKGDSMIGAGIHDGDTMIVDRSITPADGCIVIAVIDSEFTVKRLKRSKGTVSLLSENPQFDPIEFKEGQELQIFGVVTNVIHPLKP